jgi:RNA polymerase sigma-70 factor, ECF subfamily
MEPFDEIVRTEGAALARLARGYEANSDKQRGLVQEILVAIWRALPSFAGRSSLRTWVFRVAHNVAASHVRAASIKNRLMTLEQVESGDARADVEAHSDVQRLGALVRVLRPLDRQIILLHFEGFSSAEIADTTGISADNAAVKVHRIKVEQGEHR